MLKAALFTILSAVQCWFWLDVKSHQAKVDRTSEGVRQIGSQQFASDCSAEYLKVPPTLSPKCKDENKQDGRRLEPPSGGTRPSK